MLCYCSDEGCPSEIPRAKDQVFHCFKCAVDCGVIKSEDGWFDDDAVPPLIVGWCSICGTHGFVTHTEKRKE